MKKQISLLLLIPLLAFSQKTLARDASFHLHNNDQTITFNVDEREKWSTIRSVLVGHILSNYPDVDVSGGVKIVLPSGTEVDYSARSESGQFAESLQAIAMHSAEPPKVVTFTLADGGRTVRFDRGSIDHTDSARLTRHLLSELAATLGKDLSDVLLVFKHESGRQVDITDALKDSAKYELVLAKAIKVTDLPDFA
jgi:hypothetical protein